MMPEDLFAFTTIAAIIEFTTMSTGICQFQTLNHFL
jgi:hypothetical protein